MDMRGYQRYREDSLSTMTQGELLLLLFDELVKRLTQAELELEREHYPAFEAAVDRSVKILSLIHISWMTRWTASIRSARTWTACMNISVMSSAGSKMEGTRRSFPGSKEWRRN